MAAKTKKGRKVTRAGRLYDAAVRHEAAVKAWETRRANGWVHPSSKPSKRKVTAKVTDTLTRGQKAALTRKLNAEHAKRQAAAAKAVATRKKNAKKNGRKKASKVTKKVTKRSPERVTARDVRIGDHIGVKASGPFPMVTNIRDTGKSVTIVFGDETSIRRGFDKTLYRVP